MATAAKPRASRAKKPAAAELVPSSRLKRRNYGNNHAYYLDGEKLDGVTTLLGDGMRKKALEYWSANETANAAIDRWDELAQLSPSKRLEILKKARFETRDEAARKGTEVHNLAERILLGAEVDVPDLIAGHVRSAVQFLDEWKVRPILTETSVWHEKGRYAGTLDMVITSDLLPGKVILADWKTSRSGIYGETALQLAAYGNADFYIDTAGSDQPVAELGITDHWGVWIRSDGYEVYPMKRGPEVFRTFQYVAQVARLTGGKDSMDALKGAALFVPSGVAA